MNISFKEGLTLENNRQVKGNDIFSITTPGKSYCLKKIIESSLFQKRKMNAPVIINNPHHRPIVTGEVRDEKAMELLAASMNNSI